MRRLDLAIRRSCPTGRRPDDDAGTDAGNAIVEFVFVAIIVLVPLMYLVAAVAQVQRTELAVDQAAREAGRAFATSAGPNDAPLRVQAAVRLALADQGLPDDATVRFVGAGSSCDAQVVAPRLAPGAQFGVCVTRRTQLPGIPSVLAGRGITETSEYVVHIDDYRTFAP